jgi:hypothetical protein
MSQQEFETMHRLFEEGKAFNKKWSIYKIATVLFALGVFLFTVGVKYENWQVWRQSTTDDISGIKQWKETITTNGLKITSKNK